MCGKVARRDASFFLLWFRVNHASESFVTATSSSTFLIIISLRQEVAAAIKALYELVLSRDSSGGVGAKMYAFWTAGSYIEKSTIVKDRVQNALDAMMCRFARIPNSKTRSLNPETINLPPATPDPPNSIPNSQSSTLIPHCSHLNQH